MVGTKRKTKFTYNETGFIIFKDDIISIVILDIHLEKDSKEVIELKTRLTYLEKIINSNLSMCPLVVQTTQKYRKEYMDIKCKLRYINMSSDNKSKIIYNVRLDNGSILRNVPEYKCAKTKDELYDIIFYGNDTIMAYKMFKHTGHTVGLSVLKKDKEVKIKDKPVNDNSHSIYTIDHYNGYTNGLQISGRLRFKIMNDFNVFMRNPAYYTRLVENTHDDPIVIIHYLDRYWHVSCDDIA